jgi:hypothetical protein
VGDIEVKLCSPACLPVVLKLAVQLAAPQGNDGVGAANCSEHAEPFEPGADYGFASGFDDAGADKQVLAAKLRVAHAFGISLQVGGFDVDLLDEIGVV